MKNKVRWVVFIVVVIAALIPSVEVEIKSLKGDYFRVKVSASEQLKELLPIK